MQPDNVAPGDAFLGATQLRAGNKAPRVSRPGARRIASTSGALLVGSIAALASYTHMRSLALTHGQTELISTLLPVSVDGMMVVATLALGDGRRYRWSAWLAFWTGVAASILANVLAARPEVLARCISAWPAFAFLLVVEVITRGGRARKVLPPTAERWTIADLPEEAPVSPAVPITKKTLILQLREEHPEWDVDQLAEASSSQPRYVRMVLKP